MDLKIRSLEARIQYTNYKNIEVTLEDVDTDDLNTEEVAKQVSCETFFDAHGEEEILSFVKANYDWFDNE